MKRRHFHQTKAQNKSQCPLRKMESTSSDSFKDDRMERMGKAARLVRSQENLAKIPSGRWESVNPPPAAIGQVRVLDLTWWRVVLCHFHPNRSLIMRKQNPNESHFIKHRSVVFTKDSSVVASTWFDSQQSHGGSPSSITLVPEDPMPQGYWHFHVDTWLVTIAAFCSHPRCPSIN